MVERWFMLLSCSGKKVTKESGIGEAIELIAPAIRATSPMYPTRRALGVGSTEFRCCIFRYSTSLQIGKKDPPCLSAEGIF